MNYVIVLVRLIWEFRPLVEEGREAGEYAQIGGSMGEVSLGAAETAISRKVAVTCARPPSQHRRLPGNAHASRQPTACVAAGA
jgi:hypothetical protein